MSAAETAEPEQISNQGPVSDSPSKGPRVMIEGSPLRYSSELQAEPQTALLAREKGRRLTVSTSFSRWWPEVLSCVAAVCILLVLVLTLRPFQGETLSSWPLKLTLNTFVAICTLFMKASLGLILSNGIGQLKWVWYRKARPLIHLQKYDNASRGVPGSFELLWVHRGRQFIPTMGALLVILLTLFDPFGQALIRLDGCTVPELSINSTIRTVHHAELLGVGNVYELSASIKNLDPGAQDLMMIGMMNKDLIPTVPFDCRTGNCSYPIPYHSAGYCSRCRDRSEEVTAIKDPLPGWEWEAANITLIGSPRAGDVMAIAMNSTYPKDVSFGAVNIMGSELTECASNASTPWGCRGYGAATCEIYACVLSYTGEVHAGTLTETIESTSEVWGSQGSFFTLQLRGSVDISCLNSSEVTSLQQAGYNFSQNTRWLAYNIPREKDDPDFTIKDAIIRPECLYVFDDILQSSVNAQFESMFLDAEVSLYVAGTGVSVNGDTRWKSLWNQGKTDFSNVQRSFDGLAEAMTYYSRSNPSDRVGGMTGDGYTNGTSYRTTTCIDIQWAWATYLTVVVIGTIIFLLGTMVMTRPGLEVNGQDYKTSILPLLFHGIQLIHGGESYQELKLLNEITKESENIDVQFKDIERRWQFREKMGI